MSDDEKTWTLPAAPAAEGNTRKPRSRWWWLAVIAIALVIAIRAALPYALERAVESAASDAGLQVEIGDIALGLLGGALLVEDLRVGAPAAAGSSEPLLQISGVAAELSWADLLSNRVRLRSLRFDGTKIRLVEDADGQLLLPELAAGEAPDDDIASADPASETDAAGGWEFGIDRLELISTDVALHSQRTGAEAVRFTLGRLVLDSLAIGASGTEVGKLQFDAPELSVQPDWLTVLRSASGDSEPEPEEDDEPDGAAPAFVMNAIALNDGVLRTSTERGPLEIALRLETGSVRIGGGYLIPVDLELNSGDARVAIAGKLSLSPVAFEGKLSWGGLNIPPYLLLTNPGLVPWIRSADASGELDVTFHATVETGSPGLTLSGHSYLSNLSLKDPDSDELSLDVGRFEIDMTEAVYPLEPGVPPRIRLQRVLLESPHIVFTTPPDALDRFLALYTTDAAPEPQAGAADAPPPPPPSEPAGVPFEIDVGALRLKDGRILFVDRSVEPTHRTRIDDLSIETSGVALSPRFAAKKIDVEGLIQEQGTFSLTGSLPDGSGHLTFDLQRLDLVSYGSLAKSSGWEVGSGLASLESEIDVKDARYEAKNRLVLQDLSVSSREPGAFSAIFGVSLDFALALLNGPQGRINLSIPLAWDSKGLGVGLGSTLRSAAREALTGALAAPLKLVGALLPGSSGPASLEPIEFAAGSSEAPSKWSKRVESLADLLLERPRLALEIRGQASAADRPALALALLEGDVESGAALPEVEGLGLLARRRISNALRERAGSGEGALDPEDEQLLEQLVAAREVPDEPKRDLASARAQALSAALERAGAPAEALRIETSIDAEVPSVEMKLRLRARPDAAEDSPTE